MKFLANENFPLKSIFYLRSKGYNIIAIGTDHKGTKDSAIMNIAMNEERTILTFDRDYGELIFKHNYRPECGVIYLRLERYLADEPGQIIDEIVSGMKFDFNNALTIVSKHSIRQRKY